MSDDQGRPAPVRVHELDRRVWLSLPAEDTTTEARDAGWANVQKVADVLRRTGSATQRRLIEHTQLSRPVVSAAVARLRRLGLLESEARVRPEVFRLATKVGLVAGIEVGRRSVKVVLMDMGHQRLGREQEAIPPGSGRDLAAPIRQAAALLRAMLQRSGTALDDVFAIGLGIPAPVDRDGRIAASLFPDWAGTDPAAVLRGELGDVQVLVENDATLGAIGEHAHRASESDVHLVYVKLSIGIGAGILHSGLPHRGVSGLSGEFGHVSIDWQGRACECGNRGCLQTYAGGDFLLRQAAHFLGPPEDTDLKRLVRLAASTEYGHLGARRIIGDAGEKIGIALAGVVNFTSPDIIAIGGTLSDAGEILLAPMRRALHERVIREVGRPVEFTLARTAEWASALGGAMLVLRAPLSGDRLAPVLI